MSIKEKQESTVAQDLEEKKSASASEQEKKELEKINAFFKKSSKTEQKFIRLIKEDEYEEAQELNEKWLKEWDTPRIRGYFKSQPEIMCKAFLLRLIAKQQIWLEHDDEFDAIDALGFGLEFLNRVLNKVKEPALYLACSQIAYDMALYWFSQYNTVSAEDSCETSTVYIWNLMYDPEVKPALPEAELALKRLDEINHLLDLIKKENPEIETGEGYFDALKDLEKEIESRLAALKKEGKSENTEDKRDQQPAQ